MDALLEAIDILAELSFGEKEGERLLTIDEIDYDMLGATKHCVSERIDQDGKH